MASFLATTTFSSIYTNVVLIVEGRQCWDFIAHIDGGVQTHYKDTQMLFYEASFLWNFIHDVKRLLYKVFYLYKYI